MHHKIEGLLIARFSAKNWTPWDHYAKQWVIERYRHRAFTDSSDGLTWGVMQAFALRHPELIQKAVRRGFGPARQLLAYLHATRAREAIDAMEGEHV